MMIEKFKTLLDKYIVPENPYLTDWELKFYRDVRVQKNELTEKQKKIIGEIVDKRVKPYSNLIKRTASGYCKPTTFRVTK